MPFGGTYIGDGRPFAVQCVYAEAMQRDEGWSLEWRELVAQEFGLLPVAAIELSMDCNGREDHRPSFFPCPIMHNAPTATFQPF